MIDNETFKTLASLSRLKITQEEQETLQGQLNGIFDWIEQLRAVDTTGVTPVATLNLDQMPMREDVVTLEASQDQILSNSCDATFGMFSVPKVVE